MAKLPTIAERVETVRTDHIVGRGSCSVIDECFTDAELGELLEDNGALTRTMALTFCRRYHRTWKAHVDEMTAEARHMVEQATGPKEEQKPERKPERKRPARVYPWEPIAARWGARSVEELIALLAMPLAAIGGETEPKSDAATRKWIERSRKRGLTWIEADTVAAAFNRHPRDLWPAEYDAESAELAGDDDLFDDCAWDLVRIADVA